MSGWLSAWVAEQAAGWRWFRGELRLHRRRLRIGVALILFGLAAWAMPFDVRERCRLMLQGVLAPLQEAAKP